MYSENSVMRSSADDWIRTGLKLLASEGSEALTVDRLMSEMGLSKGSFYHHFSGRDDYILHLMTAWKTEMTTDIIRQVERGSTGQEKYNILKRALARSFAPEVEAAVRNWARQSPEILSVVHDVDRLRTDSLFSILLVMGMTRSHARKMARMIYSSFIGAIHIHPPASDREQQQWSDLLRDLITSREMDRDKKK